MSLPSGDHAPFLPAWPSHVVAQVEVVAAGLFLVSRRGAPDRSPYGLTLHVITCSHHLCHTVWVRTSPRSYVLPPPPWLYRGKSAHL